MRLEPRPDFTPLDKAANILIGVSGGPDSLALMHLASEWTLKMAGEAAFERKVFIATVDHGLRSGSRQEAETVARWAEAIGLPHKILIWEGKKPCTRIQERARDARYGLLREYAAEIEARVLLTAHHADDQAETILFRLLRGSGIAGLAGMEPCVAREGLIHCRPLLAMPKSALIEVCEKRGQPFLTDPSNANSAFARTRLRSLGKELAGIGLDRNALLRLGKRAVRAEKALAFQAGIVSSQLAPDRSKDGFQTEIEALATQPEEIWLRILDQEIRRVTGSSGFIRLERLESLAALLRAAWIAKQRFSATLGGAEIRLELIKNLDKSAWFLQISKEKPRRPEKPAAKPAL